MTELINKVEEKAIVQIDLEKWLPKSEEIALFDIKDFLFQGLILREKEYRESLDTLNWNIFKDKFTLIQCSNDAIIPQWAYLLVANELYKVNSVAFSKKDSLFEDVLLYKIAHINIEEYRNKRVLIKGCSSAKISIQPYIAISQILSPIVKAFSYGESCSMVPIFKN